MSEGIETSTLHWDFSSYEINDDKISIHTYWINVHAIKTVPKKNAIYLSSNYIITIIRGKLNWTQTTVVGRLSTNQTAGYFFCTHINCKSNNRVPCGSQLNTRQRHLPRVTNVLYGVCVSHSGKMCSHNTTACKIYRRYFSKTKRKKNCGKYVNKRVGKKKIVWLNAVSLRFILNTQTLRSAFVRGSATLVENQLFWCTKQRSISYLIIKALYVNTRQI